ncbi:polyprenyl synthetase family protein [Allomesorhizobium alhagi]|jgi:farnesyl diphosphate synthase|uniref:Probable farnesyl diphosphate synthase n=1 Tax=Mesorhizobium alhagi CCNWXJ12-2 TaxID=1107882 RepID=H0HLR4_9HYPH|nr:farnesyl diphosphate synthase [Mesorhizobium alhagi]EHK58322.1 polyprenyl synthetase [Mesorhizobium alhagi CCNWXJ12-2]
MTISADFPFEAILESRAEQVEALLRRLLDDRARSGEIARPASLMAAMRHGVLNGGKRLRPFLVLESAALFDAESSGEAALRAAAALECVHCYSLIHDDLPAMDDDDLRRGQPTVHRAFDEATAILAGDGLLTLAFDILADDAAAEPTDGALSAQTRLDLVLGLARAAGAGGMVGGQALDLQAEHTPPDETGIITLQAMKTGALIRFACEAGAIVSSAPAPDRERLAEFGSAIGLAFQLADDLLDLTANAETMGKATGKDQAAGKATLAALHGVDWARSQLSGLIEQAHAILEPYGERAAVLKSAASFIADRRN